jgi:hypothetical protein
MPVFSPAVRLLRNGHSSAFGFLALLPIAPSLEAHDLGAASLFAIENAAGNARRRRKTSFGAAGPTRSLPVACRSMIPPGEVFVGSRPGRARAFSERAGAWVTAWQPSQAKSTACAAVLLFACAVWVRGPVADWAHGIQREMKQRFAAQRESLNQRERQWREQQERRTRPVRRASYEEGAR